MYIGGNLIHLHRLMHNFLARSLLFVGEMAGTNQGLLDIVEVSFVSELFLLSLGKERRKLRALCPAAENAGAAILIKFCSLEVFVSSVVYVCCAPSVFFPGHGARTCSGDAQAAGHGQDEFLLTLGRV